MAQRPLSDDSFIYDYAETNGGNEASRSLSSRYRLLLGAVLATGLAGAAEGNAVDSAWLWSEEQRGHALPFVEICEYFGLDPEAVRAAVAGGEIQPSELRNFSIAHGPKAQLKYSKRGMLLTRVRSNSPYNNRYEG